VHIPMVDGVDSLNLAVAGSILMVEVLRRSLRR
jgi:tRNA G18 (ribose-2'-O)-methylase SpoU